METGSFVEIHPEFKIKLCKPTIAIAVWLRCETVVPY